jgi:hypothetical protein
MMVEQEDVWDKLCVKSRAKSELEKLFTIAETNDNNVYKLVELRDTWDWNYMPDEKKNIGKSVAGEKWLDATKKAFEMARNVGRKWRDTKAQAQQVLMVVFGLPGRQVGPDVDSQQKVRVAKLRVARILAKDAQAEAIASDLAFDCGYMDEAKDCAAKARNAATNITKVIVASEDEEERNEIARGILENVIEFMKYERQ